MKLAIGSDHAGYRLKQEIRSLLDEMNVDYDDLGTDERDSVDYPDFGQMVAESVAGGVHDLGIVICGTGIGVSITANKVPGIRAALCHDTFSARASREHNDANVLTLGERVVGPGLARDIVRTWLESRFRGGRHRRRVDKIVAVEEKYGHSALEAAGEKSPKQKG